MRLCEGQLDKKKETGNRETERKTKGEGDRRKREVGGGGKEGVQTKKKGKLKGPSGVDDRVKGGRWEGRRGVGERKLERSYWGGK